MKRVKIIAKWFLIIVGGTWMAITIGVCPYASEAVAIAAAWIFWLLVPVRLVLIRTPLGLMLVDMVTFGRKAEKEQAPVAVTPGRHWW